MCKMKRTLPILSLLFFFTVVPVLAGAQNVQVTIGGTKIDVQAPAGFHEISAISPKTRWLGEKMTPPKNRLLAMFVSEKDLERIEDGKAPELKRCAYLQTNRSAENKTISQTEFQEVAAIIKKQHKSSLDRVGDEIRSALRDASEKLSEDSGKSLKMKVGEQIPLGIFFENPNAIGVGSLLVETSTLLIMPLNG